MNKPKPRQEKAIMHFNEMIKYVEKKYHINTRDYSNSYGAHDQCIRRYNTTIAKKLRISGNTQFASHAYKRFEKWLEKNKLPSLQKGDLPYLDYWQWLLSNDFEGVHNGEKMYWNIRRILNNKRTPRYVKEITQKVDNEFRKEFNKNGGLEVIVNW